MIYCKSFRILAAAKTLAAILFFLLTSFSAGAQSLSVVPVNILFSPGQKATSLTVTNQATSETAIQIRAYAWSQKGDDDPLTATDAVIVSPPLAKIAPGATQVIRIILRALPEDREASYRILIDQIPPPGEPGIVHIALRLSIPIFAKPSVRAFADVQFHLERDSGQIYLVALNAGNLHEKIRDIVLTTSDGRKLNSDSGTSPYVLSGATRRWHIAAQDSVPLQSEPLQLTAHSDTGSIDEQVSFVASR
ncbi:MAG: molecular chaperone [Terracidiphilus sp.]|jgi:fimbrial chaperone protein